MVKNQLVSSFFQTNKEKILEIQKVRKESAVKQIRVTKPNYYNINKRSQFLSSVVYQVYQFKSLKYRKKIKYFRTFYY